MSIKQRLSHSADRLFHHPTGPAGSATGWMTGRRTSNVRRNRWAVDLLAVEPTDRRG
jgi:hypothetical protein